MESDVRGEASVTAYGQNIRHIPLARNIPAEVSALPPDPRITD
jgi:hypothetical protein